MIGIKTLDHAGAGYMSYTPGGAFGERLIRDRRYWVAWARTRQATAGDCYPGVMDDFGTLVPVPRPSPEHQQ